MCCMVIGQTYNSDSIIGVAIKIGNLEVAQNDFPKEMTWIEAKKACVGLGSGWRLPTKDELNLIYQIKDKIGGFANYHSNNYYWSSTEYDYNYAWFFSFDLGSRYYDDYSEGSKFTNYYVRAVRNF